MTELDLSHNQLETLCPEIACLERLEDLNLSRNRFTELPPEVFHIPRLQTLNLIAWRRDGNRIHVIAAADADRVLGDPAKLVRDALR